MAKEMTKRDASRIQSSQAKGGRDMSSKSFAARAQSAGDRNANANAGKEAGGALNSWFLEGGVAVVSAGTLYFLKRRWY
ncbi:hypothetical protein H2200_011114 [Cladophialophora chaetospira]|uniref:SMP domain-containing protein n=1 Tax=Cladophialophora chaetospira TaxID=386627 RepID=A0AA39CDG0_9EURO|nr:hypothetical protein H2200_011114 [Cladophialophora chaetospira]